MIFRPFTVSQLWRLTGCLLLLGLTTILVTCIFLARQRVIKKSTTFVNDSVENYQEKGSTYSSILLTTRPYTKRTKRKKRSETVTYRFFNNARDVLRYANNETVHPNYLPYLAVVKEVARKIENRSEIIRVIDGKDRILLRRILYKFHETATKNNFTYFLYGGSVLGSLRCHGLLPWDDDVDVIVSQKDREKLQKAVKKLEPEFSLRSLSPKHSKFSSKESRRTNLYFNLTWPYLDISFYDQNKTHLWDIDTPYNRKYEYKIKDILPTTLRPFEGLWLPVPRDSYTYLKNTYADITKCARFQYSHQLEMGFQVPKAIFPCETIADKYPFVYRKVLGLKTVKEILRYKNGTVVHIKRVKEPVPRQLEPYTLTEIKSKLLK